MGTAERLRAIMDERGVSVRHLSAVTGLSLSTVRRIRRCDMAGSLYTWDLVCRAVGCSVDDILGGGDGNGEGAGQRP